MASDDIYAGFETYADQYGAEHQWLDAEIAAQQAVAPPRTAAQVPRGGTAAQKVTAGGGYVEPGVRPMTSTRGAGYVSGQPSKGGRQAFDPLKQGGRVRVELQKKELRPEKEAVQMEIAVNRLLEESSLFCTKSDHTRALETAKEAGKKERALSHFREQNGLQDQMNFDLTYSVAFNLAVQYEANGQFVEALNTYHLLVKNKNFGQSPRLRINMGNIFYRQRKYSNAIRMYKMALDQISSANEGLRYRIMRNIGNTLVRMGKYQEAIHQYELIMYTAPDLQTGMNLLLSHYALGDKEKMKRSFAALLNVELPGYFLIEDDDADDVAHTDALKEEVKVREKHIVKVVLQAAKLISPVIEKTVEEGFDYVIEMLRTFELSNMYNMAGEMEMAKALMYLKDRDFQRAIEELKAFAKKYEQSKGGTFTNLSYLYFLRGEYEEAEKYAEEAITADPYSSRALVNLGNCKFVRKSFDEARQIYLDAIQAEADCIEAIYNYALTCKHMEKIEEALRAFRKLSSILPESTEIIYHVADLYDILDDIENAMEWYERLITRMPTDANTLAKLGALYSRIGDDSQAFHFHLESYRYLPVNMEVVSWLGAYFVKNEAYEKAMEYFERASEIEPEEVKWKLMVASCYRRIGSYNEAISLYKSIHKAHPDNAECLRYLVRICTDLGMQEDGSSYAQALKRVEARAPVPEEEKSDENLQEAEMAQEPVGMTNIDDNAAMVEVAPLPPPVRNVPKVRPEEEDWGTGELDDDLLPM